MFYNMSEMQSDTPLLRVEGLVVSYQERTVLDALELELQVGETVALQGPSGSGKSTLFNCIAGIQQPDAGDILLDGQSYAQMSETQRTQLRRRHTASIFQFFHLLPTLRAHENIAFAAQIAGLDRETVQQRTESLLEEVQLAHRRDALPSQLSGGEQQRVAIARALINQPKLILADEPTGNLDQKTGQAIMELLLRECQQHDITLLLATHDPAIAAACQRQIHLCDGRIAAFA